MMHEREKSDPAVVAVKLANKAERSAAESVEPRAGTEGNAGQHSTCRAQYRVSVSPALERIRHVRRQTPEVGAVCGKAARTVVCPAKAGMFSRRRTCRGRSQSPVVWIAEAMETKTFEAYRQDLLRGGYESPGRNKSKRIVASKVSIPEGRAFNRRAKAA